MGIIIILMAAGIAGGRFALQRANKIQKQSAVDNIEQALWGYYADKRRFPLPPSGVVPPTPRDLLTQSNYLGDYIDAGQFDGGADGDFYYWVGGTGQEFVVCASLGGEDDERRLGIYCTGNGMGGDDSVGIFDRHAMTEFPSDNVFLPTHPSYQQIKDGHNGSRSAWDGEERSWK